jgi:hypothetical protein
MDFVGLLQNSAGNIKNYVRLRKEYKAIQVQIGRNDFKMPEVIPSQFFYLQYKG